MRKVICLLIDDDDDDHEIFLETVTKISNDIHCIRANNGRDGVQKLTSGGPRPDIIFLDLNMPIMNGQQFLEEFKTLETLREIPVVIMSTNWNNGNNRELLKNDVIDFITKPFTLADWEASLRKVLEQFL